MSNSALFMFAAIPAILYNRSSLRRLYENCIKMEMTLQEVSQILHVRPILTTSSTKESDDKLVEVFECENNTPEKYILVFINGKLDKWYTELKKQQ